MAAYLFDAIGSSHAIRSLWDDFEFWMEEGFVRFLWRLIDSANRSVAPWGIHDRSSPIHDPLSPIKSELMNDDPSSLRLRRDKFLI
jgi:hypothetical protein